MAEHTIDVVIVTFNSENFIRQCLEALTAAAANCTIRVTVVDSASDSDVSSMVAQVNINARVVRLSKNVGYAAGNNVAIRQILATEPEPDAILILNPDVFLPPRSLEEMLSLLNLVPSCGAVSPETYDDEGNRFSRLRPLWGLATRKLPNVPGVVPVDRLPGCCMLVRPSLFRLIGLFDEAYFLYWEEVDFCVRAGRAGYDLLIAPEVTVDGGTIIKRHRAYYMWRNQVRFSLKNYGIACGLLFLARRLLVGNTREIITYLRRGKKSLVLSGLAGLWAGVCGEVGPSTSRFAAPEQLPSRSVLKDSISVPRISGGKGPA